jgi:hypothetical protein
MFVVMLSPGNLSNRGDWLEKSRLWRFILLQRSDGGWDMSESLAFALQAHEGPRPPPAPPSSKLRILLGALMGDDDHGDALDDAIEDLMTSSSDDEAANEADEKPAKAANVTDCPLSFSRAAIRQHMPRPLMALNDEFKRQQAEAAAAAAAEAARQEEATRRQAERTERIARRKARDALLAAELETQSSADPAQVMRRMWETFDAGVLHLSQLRAPLPLQIVERAPSWSSQQPSEAHERSLRSLQVPEVLALQVPPKRRRPRAHIPVERIWATVLALNTCEELDSCWLVDDEAEQMRTIVDAGREFLDAQASADRRVRKLLRSGALQKAAEKARKDWRAIQNAHVAALRDADVINRFTALTHVQRGSARVVRSLMTDHRCVPGCYVLMTESGV